MDGRTNRQTDGQKQKEKRQKSGKRVGVRASAKNKNSFFSFFWTNSVHAPDMAPLGTYVNSGTNRQTDKQANRQT
jgi:hypothetical protein